MAGRSGSSFVSQFFRDRELNQRSSLALKDENAVWKFLYASTPEGAKQGSSTLTPIEKATELAPLVYRGQADEGFGISSSLYRFIRAETSKAITEPLLFDVERHILQVARDKKLGKGLEDGPLLMLLQHYGFPTRLVDVSTGPLEALYFATEQNDAKDGRLFVFKLVERAGWSQAMDLDGLDLPWEDAHGGDWTETVSLVEPLALDPRMGAQKSKFLVGGTIRASADRNIQFGGYNNFLDKEELPQITTLSVGFHKRSPAVARTPWHALGWSIRIPGAWKAPLRRRLADVGISRDSMYPPFATVQWETVASTRDFISAL